MSGSRRGGGRTGAIHRGYDAPIASYRFMVSLRLAEEPDSHRCGGTLIAADIVLTAAHCVARVADVFWTRPTWFRQVGATALGSDSTTKLYAGFTSIPVERRWIAQAIRSLRAG